LRRHTLLLTLGQQHSAGNVGGYLMNAIAEWLELAPTAPALPDAKNGTFF
jgi:hypothetical protein